MLVTFYALRVNGDGEKGDAYKNIVQALGVELFNNQGKIMRGAYKRPALIEQSRPGHWGSPPDGTRVTATELLIVTPTKTGLDNLLELYKNASSGCDHCQTIGRKK